MKAMSFEENLKSCDLNVGIGVGCCFSKAEVSFDFFRNLRIFCGDIELSGWGQSSVTLDGASYFYTNTVIRLISL